MNNTDTPAAIEFDTKRIYTLAADYTEGDAALEIENRESLSAADALRELIAHCGDADQRHISITLDWAMHIRENEKLSWGDAIEAAMIFYFG